MLVNSVLEVAPHDPEFQRLISGMLDQVQAFFFRCVVAGQTQGTISKPHSPAEMARMLLAVLFGVRVLARACPERKLLEDAVRLALQLLRPAPAGRAKTAKPKRSNEHR